MPDPKPGERYTKRGYWFRIAFVENGEVYYVRRNLATRVDSMARVTLDVWRKDMGDTEPDRKRGE